MYAQCDAGVASEVEPIRTNACVLPVLLNPDKVAFATAKFWRYATGSNPFSVKSKLIADAVAGTM
jgi:hypothetical protein